jgi:hypothetical protein
MEANVNEHPQGSATQVLTALAARFCNAGSYEGKIDKLTATF